VREGLWIRERGKAIMGELLRTLWDCGRIVQMGRKPEKMGVFLQSATEDMRKVFRYGRESCTTGQHTGKMV